MDFIYQDPYPILKDDTPYKKLTSDFVKVEQLGDREILVVDPKGLEAVRKITVKDFPAFIITDDKGNDFFANL